MLGTINISFVLPFVRMVNTAISCKVIQQSWLKLWGKFFKDFIAFALSLLEFIIISQNIVLEKKLLSWTYLKYGLWWLRVTRSEFAVNSFFSQSYGTFQQRDISVYFLFFDMAYGKKMFPSDFLFKFPCMTTRVERLIIILFKIKCFWQIILFSRKLQRASTKKKLWENILFCVLWKAQTWSYRRECLLLNRILYKIKGLFCRAVARTVFMLKLLFDYVNKDADESKIVLFVLVW